MGDLPELRAEVKASGFAETTWQDLGLPWGQAVADEVIRTAPELLVPRHEQKGNDRECPSARSKTCMNAAKALMQPLVERLFLSDEARNRWRLFAVNYYNQGDVFSPHTDFNTPEIKTALVASLCGERVLTITGHQPLTLEPQSIVILDGGQNPEHRAQCTVGPSISVVADIPDLMY